MWLLLVWHLIECSVVIIYRGLGGCARREAVENIEFVLSLAFGFEWR
jgi:hypothetical protein